MKEEIPTTSPIRRSVRSRRKPSKLCDEAADPESDDVPLCSFVKTTLGWHTPDKRCSRVTENVTLDQEVNPTNGGNKKRGRPRKVKVSEMSENDSHTEAERGVPDEDCFGKVVPKVMENVFLNQEITTNVGTKKRGRPRKVKIIEMPENDSHTVAERLVANENSIREDVPQVTENGTVSRDITTNGGAKRRGRPRKMKIIEMSGNDSHTVAERVIADEDCFEKDAPPVTENVTFNQEITTNGSTKKRGRPRKVKIIATSEKCSRTDAEKANAEEVILRMPDPAIGDDQGKLGSVPRDEDGETRSTRRSLRRSRSVYYDQVANGGEAGEDADDPGRRKSHKKRRKRMVSETDQEMFKDVLTSIEDKLNAEGVVECHLCRKRRLTSQYAVVQHLKHNCPESKYLQTEDTALKTKPLTSLNRLEFKKLAKKRGGKIECPTESCDRSFTTVDGLRYHLKRCGKELEMSFSCEHCDKKYSSWPGLSHHLRNWHAKKTPAVSDDADSDGETPETDNGGRRKRGAAKKAIEKLHEIAEKVETQEEGSVIEDGELYKEMASTKAILRLFKAPSSYRASSDVVRSWTLEIKQTGSAACPFCKRTFRSLFPIKMHVSSCKLRPGGNGVFTCLHCETECKSKKRMLHHLRQSHEEVVNLALKEALEEKKTQWEGVEEVEEEYEQEEGGETDEDDLIKSNEEDVKRGDQKRNSIVQIKQPVKWTQDYHKKYYCPGNESLFHYWKVDPKEWVELSESDSREYHPNAKESTAFIVEECRGTQSSERGECMVLPLYGSISTEGKGAQLIFFVGGPVWAMDWCPSKSSNVQEDYVAISCYREMNNIQFYDQVESHPGLIQIWNLGSLKNRMMSPTMALGIAHDFGHTNAMKWCPSGGYQSSDATEGGGGASHRLGLLGAACSVGQVVIYAVPHPDQQYQQQSIYRPSPIAVLKPSRSDHWFGQCLCLDWSKQKGHSKVAAGFGNGCVALWNICTTSQFLVDQSNNIYPFQVLCVGHSILSAVSLNPSDDHFLLVVGSDRQTSVWDTRNPDCPLNDVSQCTSIDCCWPLYHNIGLVSTEKTGSTSKGCSVYMLDSGVLPFNSSVIALNDTIWSFSISDWLHCLAAGAEDGKVGMTMYSSDGRNFKPGSKAMVISITAVEDKPTTVKKERSKEKQIGAEINQDTRKPNDKHDRNDSEGRNSSYKGNSAMVTLSDDFRESGTVESTTGYVCNSIKKTMEDNCSSITTEDISDSTGNTQGAISDSIENSESIQGIIRDSIENTRDMQGSISDSIESTRNIQGTISDSIESTRNIQGTISDSIENTRDLQGTISDSTESTRGSMCNSIKYAVEDNCNSIAKDDISDRIRETAKQAEKNDSLKKLDDSCSANAEDGGKIIDDSTQSVNEQLGNDFKERNLIEEGGTVDETQEVNSREPTMDISKEDAVRMQLLSEPAKAGTSPERQNTEKESFEIKKSDEVVGSRKHSVDATEHENTLKGNHNVECEQQPENQTEDHMPSKHRTVESSAQSEKEPQVNENENTTELGASNSKEECSPKRELCIEDKEFDVQRILGQGDSNNGSDDATGTTLKGQDLSKYKSKITSWRGHHDASDSEKCVVYKDYLENFINSASWKSASRALLSRNVTTEEPEALIPLNAVTKLSWSPNYHSRQWLLIAGSNGIVRALQFKCFDHVKS